jgi:AraC family transcriptional regulator of adaptative response/methylated-DNA-[protein]-cysteine methyltransferase
MNMIARAMTKAPLFANDEARWQAVIDRDSRADGAFYFSVRTTGIYCRPSCAARRPRRENVEFYATCNEAEHAGFRPCKRCRPNAAAANEHREAVARACRLIAQAEEMPRLAELAAWAGTIAVPFSPSV